MEKIKIKKKERNDWFIFVLGYGIIVYGLFGFYINIKYWVFIKYLFGLIFKFYCYYNILFISFLCNVLLLFIEFFENLVRDCVMG